MSKTDLAVIIPAYREWDNVLRPLASFAIQNAIKGVRTSAFVVINQPSFAAAQVTQSNARTAEIIRALQARKIPEWLSREAQNIIIDPDHQQVLDSSLLTASMHELAERILDNQTLAVQEINLWEWSHAERDSTIGKARDRGVRESFGHIHDQSRIIMTDADAMFGQLYTANLLNTDMQTGDGPRIPIFLKPADLERAHKIEPSVFVDGVIEWLAVDLLRHDNNLTKLRSSGFNGFHKGVGWKRIISPHGFEGPNMFFTREIYEKSGGFPHVQWAEDTIFYERVLRAGYEPGTYMEFSTAIIERSEERSTTGNSNLDNMQHNQITVSLDGRRIYMMMFEILIQVKPRNRTIFEAVCLRFFPDEFTLDERNTLWKYWELAEFDLWNRSFNEVFAMMLRKKFQISYRDALAELETEIKSGAYRIDQGCFLSMLPPAYEAIAYLDEK